VEAVTPYSAPSSEVKDPKANSSSTAILVGAAVGNGVSYAVLFLMGLVFLWVLAAQGVSQQELYARAYQSTGYLVFAHVVALVCCAPGGLWSARLGPDKPYRNALLAGSIVSALALSANLMPYELPIPLWSRVASVIIPLPAFLLGAYWQQRGA
jgi:hypothetical protein